MAFPTDAESFSREYGCTEAEWRGWLRGPAVGEVPATPQGADAARVTLAEGHLSLRWTVLPERRIALVRLPRLQVDFRFEGVPLAARQAWLKRFDLHTQRGGG